jgi:hypothetical protein
VHTLDVASALTLARVTDSISTAEFEHARLKLLRLTAAVPALLLAPVPFLLAKTS